MADEKREVVFHYVEDGDSRTYYANGAFGGVSPKGEIVVNFFIDHTPIPTVEAFAVDSAGMMGKQTRREEKYETEQGQLHVQRRVVARMVMNLADAQSIAQWLSGKVTEVMGRREQGGKK